MEDSTNGYIVNNTTTQGMRGAEEYSLHKIALWLDDYSTYILTALAVVLNSAAFITICSMKPLTSTSIYIAALAVVDTLCLVFKLLTTRLVRIESIPEELACGVLLCVFFFVQFLSSFLIVTISVERFVAVWFPFKVNRVFTRKVALGSILGLSIGILPLSAWSIWFYERYYDENWGIVCVVKLKHVRVFSVFRKIHPLIYMIIPFIVVLILNVSIIVGLRKAVNGNLATGNGTLLRSRISRRLSVMLVVTSVAFLVLELPMVCIGLFKYFEKKDTSSFVQSYFFVEVAQTLEDTNHAVNFILYFLSGEKFRKLFLSMVSLRFCKSSPGPDHTPNSVQTSERVLHRAELYSMINHPQSTVSTNNSQRDS